MNGIAPLHHDLLAWNCREIDPASGGDASPIHIGQERAVEALRTGIELYAPGFNIFVTGLSGTERAQSVVELLEQIKVQCRVVEDRVFVHDFIESRSPTLLELPRGQGRHFRADVERVYASVMQIVPKALASPNLAERRRAIQAEFASREQALFQDLVAEAKTQGLAIVRIGEEPESEGPVEADIFPVFGENAVPPEALTTLVREGKLEAAQAERLSEARQTLLTKLHEVRAKSQELALEMGKRLDDLAKAVCKSRIRPLFLGLAARWEGEVFKTYFDRVQTYVVDNLKVVFAYVQASRESGIERRPKELDVKLIARADTRTGERWDCPVVLESNPTLASVFGTVLPPDEDGPRLAHIVEGALLRADGGFVVLRLADLLQADLWNPLKRVLKSGVIEIRPPEGPSPFPMSPLEPDPIEISTKVVVIGDEGTYELLCEADADFKKVFKVHAQFEQTMRLTDGNLELYASAVRRIVAGEEGLLPATSSGLARLAECGARIAGSQRRLSTRFGEIADIYREASYLATRKGERSVERKHVQAAEAQRERRLSLPRESFLERVEEGLFRFEVVGAKVGQINGLVVLNSAAWGYGRPTRITAQVGVGVGRIINIERESELSGPIHEKGVQILSGYLLGTYAHIVPLRLSATICFEQSYSGVDGDSASSTELYALLSALADVPIAQGIAVTGSVDQFGRIQAVGGVNEKIEGFFEVCSKLGLDGRQGCILPRSNVDALMLRPEVVDAVRNGSFRIWAIDSIDEGIEILTGMPAGTPDGGDCCVKGRVLARLRGFAEQWRAFAGGGDGL